MPTRHKTPLSATQDLHYLEYAFELAKKGQYTTSPNPCVGCVLVKDKCIIGEGWHQSSGQAHAEVNALNDAKRKGYQTNDATAYITLEPCNHTGKTPPCTKALIHAQIKRVVIAMPDVDHRTAMLGIKKLQDNGIEVDSETAKNSDVQHKVKKLCRGYLSRNLHQKPYITLKIASSIDGKIALHNSDSKWITGENARADVQLLRRQNDVILTTRKTIEKDNPYFTTRLSQEQKRKLNIHELPELSQPTLAILDTNLTLDFKQKLNILTAKRDIWIFHSDQIHAQKTINLQNTIHTLQQEKQTHANIKLIPISQRENTISGEKCSLDLTSIFHYLNKQLINTVLIEAGSTLNGALLQSTYSTNSPPCPLIDEYIYYINSKILGTNAQDPFYTSTISQMTDTHSLIIDEVQRISDHDIKLTMHHTTI